MLPDFKRYKRCLFALLMAFFAFDATAQKIVYDLRQDWVYFDDQHQGFLPVDDQEFKTKVISFKLPADEFDKFYLTIAIHHQAFLFYRKKLLATIPAGISSYKIDSLKQIVGVQAPFLSLYGDNLLPELTTLVQTHPVVSARVAAYQPIRYANNFSNFFYLAATLIIVFFVVLKTRFPELADQYLMLHRTFRIKTIDELIYKIPYLGFPNILFITFISLLLSLLMISFMYFYPGQLDFLDINPEASSFLVLISSWLKIFVVVFLLLVLKYFLTVVLASVFSIKIANIHYATSLRFIIVLALIMMGLTLVQVFMVGVVPEPVFWLVFILSMLIMEVILFLKLTLVSTHTLLYIIVYLCATEIIPIVFLFELVII